FESGFEQQARFFRRFLGPSYLTSRKADGIDRGGLRGCRGLPREQRLAASRRLSHHGPEAERATRRPRKPPRARVESDGDEALDRRSAHSAAALDQVPRRNERRRDVLASATPDSVRAARLASLSPDLRSTRPASLR